MKRRPGRPRIGSRRLSKMIFLRVTDAARVDGQSLGQFARDLVFVGWRHVKECRQEGRDD